MQLLRRPFDGVALVALAFVLLAMAMAGMYWQSMLGKQAAQRAAAQQHNAWRAGQLNEAVTQQLDATLRSVDIALKHMRAVYLQDPADFERAAKDVVLAYPTGMIESITVANAQGRMQASYSGLPRRTVAANSGNSEYFRVHANGEADTLFISGAQVDPASADAVVQITRGIWQQHRFLGVIGIPIRPDYLSRHLLSLRVDPADILAVVRPDGSTVARSHNLADALKSRLPSDRPFLKAQAGRNGMFRSTSTFDNVPMLFSWQRLTDWPLITVAAVNEVTELEPLSRAMSEERLRTAQSIALLVASAIGLSVLVVRTQQQKLALRLSEGRHRALFDHSKIPILVVDPGSGAIVKANEAACGFYGYALERMRQMLISDFHQLSPAQIEAEMSLALQEKRSCFQFPHRLANGEVRQVEVYSGPIEVDGRTLLYSFVHDITDRKLLEDQVRQLAFHDALTALPNRRLLLDRINRAIAANRRTPQYSALLFLDLDNFKPLNDQHGHDVGDVLLVEVARRLCSCVREMDTVARFGGDEFVVMLSILHTDKALSLKRAQAIAEKIGQSLAEPYVLAVRHGASAAVGVTHHCTASIGLTLFCNGAESAEELLSQADTAMYLAKGAGRKQTASYASSAPPDGAGS
jgi:diguanylate cyclase (GGDEF)-like protein/PAS domain S-box-containing protein